MANTLSRVNSNIPSFLAQNWKKFSQLLCSKITSTAVGCHGHIVYCPCVNVSRIFSIKLLPRAYKIASTCLYLRDAEKRRFLQARHMEGTAAGCHNDGRLAVFCVNLVKQTKWLCNEQCNQTALTSYVTNKSISRLIEHATNKYKQLHGSEDEKMKDQPDTNT